MQVISEDLKTHIDTWSDPGDYPSGAGGGPLPSYDFVEDIEGTVTVQLTPQEQADLCSDLETGYSQADAKRYREAVQEYINDNPPKVKVDGAEVTRWTVDSISTDGLTLTLSMSEFEATELPEPEPLD